MSENKKLAMSAMALTIAGIGIAGTTQVLHSKAYLTDNKRSERVYTVGEVGIEIDEGDYTGNDSPETQNLVPNQEVVKSPLIRNTKVNDAVVFITVDSPMAKVSLINDDNLPADQELQELFYFKKASDDSHTRSTNFNKDKWSELKNKESYIKIDRNGKETKIESLEDARAAELNEGDVIVRRYVFGYSLEIQGSNPSDGDQQEPGVNDRTLPVFDKIQLKNIIENNEDLSAQNINITAYAIQSDELFKDNDNEEDPENSGTIGEFDADKLEEIYNIYIAHDSDTNSVNP